MSSRILSNIINDKILLTAKALRPDDVEKVLPNSNEEEAAGRGRKQAPY